MGWLIIKEILGDTALLASLSKLTYEVYGYIKKLVFPSPGGSAGLRCPGRLCNLGDS